MSDPRWLDGAIRKEISKHRRGPRPYTNRVQGHVAVSEASSLFGYFSGAAVCSTLYIRKSTPKQLARGEMADFEQYLPLDNYSKADGDGNDASISVETQGGVHDAQNEPWDAGQVKRLAWIFAECVKRFPSLPVRLATSSKIGEESKGLSWHRLGIDGNFPALPSLLAGRLQRGGGMHYSKSYGKICPGNAKIAQMPEVLALAAAMLDETVASPPSTPSAPPPAPVGNGGGVKNWLQKGDRGDAVRSLQSRLKALGYYGSPYIVDGLFGNGTEKAVRAFQSANGLVIDGLAGPATMAALTRAEAARATKAKPVSTRAASSGTVLRRGSSGSAVKALQKRLNKNYPAYSRLVEDGLFGPATEAVVREFQRRAGLTVDGIVGPQTRAALGL